MKLILAANEKYPVVFAPRNVLEEDETFRQIIPYIVIQNESGKYALFQRHKGNEKRLSGKKTIGIGGHIDVGDMFFIPQIREKFFNSDYSSEAFVEEMLFQAIYREVKEEIGFHSLFESDLTFLGNIEINDTSVDKVHKGYVYSFFINSDLFLSIFKGVKEKELIFLDFKTKQELEKEENLENWSEFVIKNFL
ncbi:MAG: NUDIX domain-containing protein [Patescibacteria group bacterium]|nr:NUDIX domain-containing protein [Patescibacteria group bacterium]